ncbi:hypothetical protein RJ55_01609 [Drechmeria coniospora]|nr:hypothetical protein RJ55_01609 [Drechmeria coniospora]
MRNIPWLTRYYSPPSLAAGRLRPHSTPACRLRHGRTLTSSPFLHHSSDPRVRNLGREISDEYASVRDVYLTPKHPIVLAHGLLGFAELSISSLVPPLRYWHGIEQALATQGCPLIITASVPPSHGIEERAAKLAADISASIASSKFSGDPVPVNIIAHSMGGLDARYMISRLQRANSNFRVAALVTVGTPHRGSPFADYVLHESAGPLYLPRLYSLLERAGLGTRAFAQLTTRYLATEFNPRTRDDPAVRYFSYGAVVEDLPLFSPFRLPQKIIAQAEGPNDGLVGVDSSRWGQYEGTLLGVSHLDLINWSNRARWTVREWMGVKRNFNAVAFYLGIADMLAREGL